MLLSSLSPACHLGALDPPNRQVGLPLQAILGMGLQFSDAFHVYGPMISVSTFMELLPGSTDNIGLRDSRRQLLVFILVEMGSRHCNYTNRCTASAIPPVSCIRTSAKTEKRKCALLIALCFVLYLQAGIFMACNMPH